MARPATPTSWQRSTKSKRSRLSQAVAASSSTTSTGATRRSGQPDRTLGFNTIALLDSDGLATKNFANISQLLMSWDQMNPEYITKTGHIKLTDEGNDILRGYLTVLDYKLNDGRNVAFQVMPGKYGGNTSESAMASACR